MQESSDLLLEEQPTPKFALLSKEIATRLKIQSSLTTLSGMKLSLSTLSVETILSKFRFSMLSLTMEAGLRLNDVDKL